MLFRSWIPATNGSELLLRSGSSICPPRRRGPPEAFPSLKSFSLSPGSFFSPFSDFSEPLTGFDKSLAGFYEPFTGFFPSLKSLSEFLKSLSEFLKSLSEFLKSLSEFLKSLSEFLKSLSEFLKSLFEFPAETWEPLPWCREMVIFLGRTERSEREPTGIQRPCVGPPRRRGPWLPGGKKAAIPSQST
jgi:hypothetical protein